MKVLKTHMKMATAVAIRAAVATNIAQTACERTKNDFANGKTACEQKKNTLGKPYRKQALHCQEDVSLTN